MAEIVLDCPWCSANNSAFTSVAAYMGWDYTAGGRGGSRHEVWFAFLRCRRCGGGVAARFKAYEGYVQRGVHEFKGDPLSEHWSLLDWFPSKPVTDTCPEHVPETVLPIFNEARDSLQAQRWNAAGAMYRKAIDVATKALVRTHWPEAEVEKGIKEDLIVRIERLHGRGLLTDSLKDWAHQVRIGGKDATHDEDLFTKEEAEALHQFTRLFLTYAFTMPEEVRLRRPAEAKADDAVDAEGEGDASTPEPTT